MKNQRRTNSQNRALHKWFTELSDLCLDVGLEAEVIFKDVEVSVSSEMIKSIFRAMGKRKFGKESTADLDKKEFQQTCDELIKHFAKLGLSLPPFPNIDDLEIKKYYG